jgi:hypothetical protein
MKLRYWIGSILIAIATAGSIPALGEEASGTISETGFGSFTLTEKGVSRKFNLPTTGAQYEPSIWRPTAGDAVTVTFEANQNKRGATVLAVKKMVLVKAGPDTVVNLESPVSVELTEVGRTGVKGKIPKGQIVRFAYQKTMQKVPAGWIPGVGEKVIITFQVKIGRGVDRLIEKMEKAP